MTPATPIARLTAFRDHILATDNTINASRFEQICGLANGYFKSHASYSNERGISSDSIIKVKRAFPQLNVEWVLLGTGHMLATHNGIPLYAIPFTSIPITPAGIPSPDITPTAYLNATPATTRSRVKGGFAAVTPASFACISTDQAMQTDIPINTTVILTPADHNNLTPAYLAHPFAIILTDGARLIRHIATYTKRTVTLAPTEKTPAFAPITIPAKDIAHLYQVTASIRLFTKQ